LDGTFQSLSPPHGTKIMKVLFSLIWSRSPVYRLAYE